MKNKEIMGAIRVKIRQEKIEDAAHNSRLVSTLSAKYIADEFSVEGRAYLLESLTPLKITQFLMLLVFSLWWSGVFGQDSFSYKDIAERYRASRLSTALVDDAKMQGECLVGLKKLNFRKREDFDPVAEWTNYRSLSLLDQFPPCAVLIMMEVARTELIKESPGGEKPGGENRADVDIRGE